MGKTELTKDLEMMLYSFYGSVSTFGCFEVTIGKHGNERVDFMSYDANGIWRCYEIKVSLSDFRSKAKKTFVGNFNYFVLTRELYHKVKDEIEPWVGVIVNSKVVKKPKKQELKVSEEVLMYSMMRSLFRESDKRQKELLKKWREERRTFVWAEH